MPRVLLVLPTRTYRAAAFLSAAAALGVEVVTASEEPQALAGVMGDHFLALPLGDPAGATETIVAFAARVALDAVLAVDDQGVVVAALAATRLGLVANPHSAVAATRDKVELRRLLAAGGVAQPDHLVVDPHGCDDEELAAMIIAAAGRLGYPCVVKPSHLAASRGVIRIDDDAAAGSAAVVLAEIFAEEPDEAARIVVEVFVPGAEVALEGLLESGALRVLALFDKPDPLDGPYFEETIYVTPSRHDAAAIARVEATVAAACQAIGLREGPVHAELRIGDDGTVTLLEIAARTIGGRCSTALSFAAGATLEQIVLAHALGLAGPKGAAEGGALGAAGVMMLPIPSSGRLVAVHGQDAARMSAHVTGLEITIAPGRPVRALPLGDRYLGFLFARADSPAVVEEALRAAFSCLAIEIATAPTRRHAGALR